MNIQQRTVGELSPADYNPRTISDIELEKLKRSIEEFGYIEPIIWNETTERIVGGHQRVRAMLDLGMEKEKIDVVVVELPEHREKALNLALNRIAGEWDNAKLAELLQGLDDEDLDLTGFDESEVSRILDGIEMQLDPEDDDVPEPPKEAKAQPGDIYALGEHRVMCGDATNLEDVERLMDGQKADMVLTDPPYNTGMQGKNNGKARLSHMFDDNFTPEEFNDLLDDVLTNYYTVTKSEAAMYVCIDWRNVGLIKDKMVDAGLDVKNVIVWDKVTHGLGSDYKFTYELIVVGKKGSPRINTKFDDDYKDIWHIQRQMGRNKDHATAKPVELCQKPIKHASKKDDIVLDLFGGSGSTLIAAENLDRRCYMMEKEPKYIDVIIKRWEQKTGEKAGLWQKK